MKKLFTQSSELVQGAYQKREREAGQQWSRIYMLVWDDIRMTVQDLLLKHIAD